MEGCGCPGAETPPRGARPAARQHSPCCDPIYFALAAAVAAGRRGRAPAHPSPHLGLKYPLPGSSAEAARAAGDPAGMQNFLWDSWARAGAGGTVAAGLSMGVSNWDFNQPTQAKSLWDEAVE